MAEIHPSHNPEPAGDRIYCGGTACRRCGWFVAFDEDGAFQAKVTERGSRVCVGPVLVELREATP
jgi:hypothetical protein